MGAQVHARGQSQHLAGGEGRLHETHHAPAHLQGEEIGDDGHAYGADHAAEQAGDDAGGDEEPIGVGDAA